jgi:hypothetical protein
MVRDDGEVYISFDWGFGSLAPACGIGAGGFSIRWTRAASFQSGRYRFTARSDDGIRLYIDGRLLVDAWIDQWFTTYTSEIDLTEGNHDLRVEYYQNGGVAAVQISWEQLAVFGVDSFEIQKRQDKLQRMKSDIINIPPIHSDWQALLSMQLLGSLDEYNRTYLLAVDRRELSLTPCIAASSYLRVGDLKGFDAAYGQALSWLEESAGLFAAAEGIALGTLTSAANAVNSVYQLSSRASRALSGVACGPPCQNVVGVIFTATDYAVDRSMYGVSEGNKKFFSDLAAEALLHQTGIGPYLDDSTTHLVGQSGVYQWLVKTGESAEASKTVMRLLARSATELVRYISEEKVAETFRHMSDAMRTPGSPPIVPAPKIDGFTSTPDVPTARNFFNFTIVGSGFDPATVDVIFTGPGCVSGCNVGNVNLGPKTTTQLGLPMEKVLNPSGRSKKTNIDTLSATGGSLNAK